MDALRQGQMAFFVAIDDIATSVDSNVRSFQEDREKFVRAGCARLRPSPPPAPRHSRAPVQAPAPLSQRRRLPQLVQHRVGVVGRLAGRPLVGLGRRVGRAHDGGGQARQPGVVGVGQYGRTREPAPELLRCLTGGPAPSSSPARSPNTS